MSKQGCKTLRKMFVFMALFPPLRALPPVPSTADAPRESLSRAPFPPPPCPRLVSSSPLPPRSSSLRSPSRRLVSRNARRFLLPLLGSSLRASVPSFHPSTSSFVIPTRSLRSGRKGGPTTRRARTAGRDRPHRRGHHFNVTLIKSNNQYLPRKKF